MHKLLIVVELLLGEIPDRLQFRQPSLKRSLMPYFLLTQGKADLEPCPWPDACVHLHQLSHPVPTQLLGQEILPSSTKSWISLGRSFKQMGPTP